MSSADWDGNKEYRTITVTDANGKPLYAWSGPRDEAPALPLVIESEDIDRDEHFSRAIGQALIDEALGSVQRLDDDDNA